ncbi:MAG: hypothetical protein KAG61_03795 [Bacteriovoracaceae bacterium]|nr:hypothetical protein [Bacteriovoracaceae bacterium]
MPKKGSVPTSNNESRGDYLNRISGNKTTTQYVDRKKHNQLGKDGFMKLLAHQMQNQDPMNPMDQKQFAADLAQFAQLEQLSNINTMMKASHEAAKGESKNIGASFLGKKIITSGTSLKFDGEDRISLPFTLNKNAEKVIVRVMDSKNQLVQQLNFDQMMKGSQSVDWDGMATNNKKAGKGDYQIQVYAWDENMSPFAGETKTAGIVTGVSFENGDTILKIDGKKSVFLRDVDSFQLVGNNRPTNTTTAKQAAKSYDQVSQMQ